MPRLAARLAPLLAAAVLAVTLYAGFRPLGPVPPLGRLLNPADGFWSAAATASHPREASGRIPALGAGVRVLYDDRGVPHIFASSTLDAVRALGWVVARDRLFQMDVQARAGEGSLTELAGARAIEADETPRRLGMRWGAERKLAAMDTASEGARVMAAYAEGVNAYLDALPAAEWPVEYRLLGARPSRWSPLRSVYLLQRMAWTLSYDRLELDRARVAALVGAEAAESLFPVNSPIQEPIVPRGTVSQQLQPATIAPPGRPDAEAAAIANLLALASPTGSAMPDEPARGTIGSNSWAVAPSRSASGHALLAGDPHLGLTLPSIWYEAHLVVPGELDVYGVTIPGAPGIIIGFNRDVAWTFTNSYGDVMDYWAETVDDSLRPTRYRVDGAWRPLETRLETYRAPDGSVIRTDTIRIGHRGPLVREGRRWLSIRWTALEPSNEMDGFTRAVRARSAREYLDLLGSAYRVPAQNALAADRGGHIAVRATGRFPLRPDGARIHDGSTSASDWTGWRALAQWPQAVDPPQGFLATANQQAVDPRVDPLYYGADFRDPWRALRINALLRADTSVTVEDMRRWQTDPGSARADLFVPWFLEAAGRAAATPDAGVAEAARLLAAWDRRYVRESEGAVLFEAAMRELGDRTWDELVPAGRTRGEPGARVATPGAYVFASLLPDAANAWWDDRATPATERRDDILAASLRAALQRVRSEHGEPGASWRWGRVHSANIPHLLYLRPFGAYGLDVQGGPNTLAPSAGRGMDGPSWRMVVELGPELRAWATYPGGQSGNPASPRYRERIPQWQAGELDPVLVPRTPADIPAARVAGELKLEGGR